MAGIMGGLNSEIQDTTKEVMFEAAKFARDNIRKSSRALDSPLIPAQCMQRVFTNTQLLWQ